MDEVTKNMVTAQLKSAKTKEALNDALVSAMIAVVDCQCKTAERVKKLSWKVFAIVFAGGGGAGSVLTHIEQIAKFFGN